MAFNLFELVGRHLMGVKHHILVVEHIPGCSSSEEGTTSTRNAIWRLRQNALVCLHVVVEAAQVEGHVSVPDPSTFLVLEHQQVFMQFSSLLLVVLHSLTHVGSLLQHLHQVSWVSHVALVLIQREKVLRDVLQVALEARPPLIPKTKLVQARLVQSFQVDRAIAHTVSQSLPQL